MAKNKENFKIMGAEEIKKKLVTLRTTLRDMHFKAEGAKSKNVRESRMLRKSIARVLTEINNKARNK